MFYRVLPCLFFTCFCVCCELPCLFVTFFSVFPCFTVSARHLCTLLQSLCYQCVPITLPRLFFFVVFVLAFLVLFCMMCVILLLRLFVCSTLPEVLFSLLTCPARWCIHVHALGYGLLLCFIALDLQKYVHALGYRLFLRFPALDSLNCCILTASV